MMLRPVFGSCLKKLGTGGLLSKYAKDMVDHLAAGSKAVEKDMSAMMVPQSHSLHHNHTS